MRKTRQEIQKSEKYWKEATDFVRRLSDDPKNPSWFEITREMPEHIVQWGDYFRWRIGFVTSGLVMLENSKINVFFVPAEWPEWFDSHFAGKGNQHDANHRSNTDTAANSCGAH